MLYVVRFRLDIWWWSATLLFTCSCVHHIYFILKVHTSIMFCLCDIADNAGVIVNPKGEMKGIVLKVLMVYMHYNYSAIAVVENHP